MLKECQGSLLDWFGKLYRQAGSLRDQDGNVYLVFERSRLKLFKERIVLRMDWLEPKVLGHLGTIYAPRLKHE
jgi:hypothetical protein